MKVVRFCLLVLLAVLLPLRGALAQALPCAGGHGGHAAHAMPGHAHDGARAHAQAHSHGHSNDPAHGHPAALLAGADAHHDHGMGEDAAGAGADSQGQCSACASCCIGAPVASPVAAAPPLLPVAGLKFPSWSSPVPSVVLDGLDPPPRRA